MHTEGAQAWMWNSFFFAGVWLFDFGLKFSNALKAPAVCNIIPFAQINQHYESTDIHLHHSRDVPVLNSPVQHVVLIAGFAGRHYQSWTHWQNWDHWRPTSASEDQAKDDPATEAQSARVEPSADQAPVAPGPDDEAEKAAGTSDRRVEGAWVWSSRTCQTGQVGISRSPPRTLQEFSCLGIQASAEVVSGQTNGNTASTASFRHQPLASSPSNTAK